MNRVLTAPIASMSDCPVQWRELIPLFRKIFPRTIQDCQDNDRRARVNFCGTPFDIIPEVVPGFEPAFSVWGPPHLNQFPDAI
jgi:hypothetical protein